MLGKSFVAESFTSMCIIDDRKLCGILVAPEKDNNSKLRVADLANLKPQTGRYADGYGEFDAATQKFSGSHVMIIKRGQQAVFEGKIRLRFFMRVVRGTNDRIKRITAEDAWNFRITVFGTKGPLWHEYFTKKKR